MMHTPGPWRFNDNTQWWKTNPFSVTVRKHGVHSATVANIPARATITPEEQQANARLIAAAPELLAALEAADKWVAMYHTLAGHEAASECMSRVIRAAIKKATGEQA